MTHLYPRAGIEHGGVGVQDTATSWSWEGYALYREEMQLRCFLREAGRVFHVIPADCLEAQWLYAPLTVEL